MTGLLGFYWSVYVCITFDCTGDTILGVLGLGDSLHFRLQRPCHLHSLNDPHYHSFR